MLQETFREEISKRVQRDIRPRVIFTASSKVPSIEKNCENRDSYIAFKIYESMFDSALQNFLQCAAQKTDRLPGLLVYDGLGDKITERVIERTKAQIDEAVSFALVETLAELAEQSKDMLRLK